MSRLKCILLIVITFLFFTIPVFADIGSNSNLIFTDETLKEYSKEKKYSYKINYPRLVEYSDKNVEKNVNKAIYSIILEFLNSFKKQHDDYWESCNHLSYDSRLELNYIIANKADNILSLKFKGYSTYYCGSPGYPETSLNYNLSSDSLIKLADLFKSSYYINMISDYCNTELKKRFEWWNGNKVFLETDIKNFTMTQDSLIVMLGVIGSNADGPQEVKIPYSALKDIIDPAGPAGRFLD